MDRIQELEERYQEVSICNDLEQLKFKTDKELLHLQIKIDSLSMLMDFDREVDLYQENSKIKEESIVVVQNKNSIQLFEKEDIEKIIKMPKKRSDLSELIEKYESEHQYLESLNLKKVVQDVNQTLDKSIIRINEHIGMINDPLSNLDFKYDLLLDATQQKEYLTQFNQRIVKFVSQLLNLNDYIKSKEKLHLAQIESLTAQNQVLFEENCTLHKELQMKNQQSHQTIKTYKESPNGKENDYKLKLKEQKKIVKEIINLQRDRLESLKSSILQENLVFESSPHLQLSPNQIRLSSLPLDDPSLHSLISDHLTFISNLQHQLCEKLAHQKTQEERQKTRITSIMHNYNVFKGVFDRLVQKDLPRCRVLLEIGKEYFKNTINHNKELCEQIIKDSQSQNIIPNMNILNLIKCHDQVIMKIDNILTQVL